MGAMLNLCAKYGATERIEAARIAAGVSESSNPQGPSEVTTFLERFEAEGPEPGRRLSRTGEPGGAAVRSADQCSTAAGEWPRFPEPQPAIVL